jgi:hypothetical protein
LRRLALAFTVRAGPGAIVAIQRGQWEMNTGQTILTIGALVLLATILTNFYGTVAIIGDDISDGQDDILATAVATSWAELAQGMAFDNVTDTSDIAFQNPSVLTSHLVLGVEGAEKTDSIATYNDFDDFNGALLEKQTGTTGKVFATRFAVCYVDSNDVNTIVSSKTFVKRMDMATWRLRPAPHSGERIDTLRTSIVYSYFNFN